MLLSILIRNLNEAENLKVTLQSIRKQVCEFAYEIVVVDNESEDNSVEIALAAGAKVVSLKRGDFSFGYALNFGIEHCAGEIILIMSAHVVLLSELFLQQLPNYFNDEKVAGLRFINAADRQQVMQSIQEGPRQLVYTGEAGFADVHWVHLLVNHCAAIRRSCWKLLPFDSQLIASEDKRWSLDILKKGFTLVYHVQCFYLYIKQPSRDGKIKRMAIESIARELITGTTIESERRGKAGLLSMHFRQLYTDWIIDREFRKQCAQLKKLINANE